MKKLLIVSFLIVFLICSVGLVACSEDVNEPIHTHTFEDKWESDNSYHWHLANCGHNVTSDKIEHKFINEVVTIDYLSTPATCTAKATYFKSCECGAKGTETFEYGEKLSHAFDREIVAEKYLKALATCTAKATYFKSCECGEKGTETFEYGENLSHTFDRGSSSEKIPKRFCNCRIKGEIL